MIIRVEDENTANICDELLTLLIQDERKYDNKISSNFIVKDYFKNVIKDNNNYLLCYKEDSKIVGFIYFKPVVYDGRKGYLIDGLYVLEEYRNKKIASSLIDEALELIKKTNSSYVEIYVLNGNDLAMKIYESYGFKVFRTHLKMDIN